MDLSFLPINIYNAISRCDINLITEIRIRNGFKIKLKLDENFYYLSENGLTILESEAILCQSEDLNYIIKNITEHSLYAFNDKIKNGYLTTKDGIRIGLAGECVTDNGQVVTLKNFNSLNVRIPHEQFGCSDKLFEYVYESNINNTLIISPPLYGKTTLLKDLIRKLNSLNNISILVVDERGEFSSIKGENVDLISYSDKVYAFENGIRALAPNVIITDELMGKADWLCVSKATRSGVKVIASCHGTSLNDVVSKEGYIAGVFEKFIVLKTCGQAGIINKVYDVKYKEI